MYIDKGTYKDGKKFRDKGKDKEKKTRTNIRLCQTFNASRNNDCNNNLKMCHIFRHSLLQDNKLLHVKSYNAFVRRIARNTRNLNHDFDLKATLSCYSLDSEFTNLWSFNFSLLIDRQFIFSESRVPTLKP